MLKHNKNTVKYNILNILLIINDKSRKYTTYIDTYLLFNIYIIIVIKCYIPDLLIIMPVLLSQYVYFIVFLSYV